MRESASLRPVSSLSRNDRSSVASTREIPPVMLVRSISPYLFLVFVGRHSHRENAQFEKKSEVLLRRVKHVDFAPQQPRRSLALRRAPEPRRAGHRTEAESPSVVPRVARP